MSAMLINLPFSLPDWLPGWVLLLLALPVLLYLLAFLLMPFSVFGVKARIESLEAQIELAARGFAHHVGACIRRAAACGVQFRQI